jgi:glucose 1-dehydrogenase
MSDVDLEGKVAVVTGASLGIGRATAIALGRAGASVIVNYRSHADQAEQVAQAIRDLGRQAVAHQADVADWPAVERLIAAGVDHFGRVDIAVSNAAYSDRELFFEADLAGFRRTIDVTMWGAFHLLRAAAEQMIRQQSGGVVVLVSSPHAFIPVPRAMAYNMAKAAIEQMAKTAAVAGSPCLPIPASREKPIVRTMAKAYSFAFIID